MSPSTDSSSTISAPAGQAAGSVAFDEPPDDFFAVVVGLSTALVVAPLVTALASRVVAGPGIVYLVLLGSALSVTILVALAVRRQRGLPQRLGGSNYRWVPALAGPAFVAITAVGALAAGGPTQIDTILGVVAGGGGVVAGGLVGVMAGSRYAKAVTAQVEQYATWRAGWSDRRKRPLEALSGLAIAAGVVAFVVAITLGEDLLRLAGQMLVSVAVVVFTVGQARTYTATPAGLEEKLPAARTLHDWSQFEGYVLADDAIVVHRRAPWRFPVICAREDIDDEESVVAALDRALPRLPAPRP